MKLSMIPLWFTEASTAPAPGSANERTRDVALENGRLHAGEVTGLRGLRNELEAEYGVDVDISVVREGGSFDHPPRLDLLR